MFGQSEIYNYRTYGAAVEIGQDNVLGLYVEVRYPLFMQECHSLQQRTHHALGLFGSKRFVLLPADKMQQVVALDILHNIIGRGVGAEHLVHGHDIGMRNILAAQAPGLGDEVIDTRLDCVFVCREIRNLAGGLAQAQLFAEILFHGKVPAVGEARHQVGYAEAALTEHAVNPVAVASGVDDSSYRERSNYLFFFTHYTGRMMPHAPGTEVCGIRLMDKSMYQI